MEQLLNSGIGYGYQMPPVNDPDDDRTDEERMRDGCFMALVYVVVLVMFFFTMSIFTSCSTSRTAETTKVERGDSLVTDVERTTHTTGMEASDVKTAFFSADSSLVRTDSEENEVETIVENITETMDSFGNRNVTTQRTTMRSRKAQENSMSLARRFSSEEELKLHLSYLDSLASAHAGMYAKQWNDSIVERKETKGEVDKMIYLTKAVNWMFRALGVVVCARFFLSYKHHKNDK